MKIERILKIISILAVFLSVFSAAIILYFILKYGVDVPYMDQWNYAEFFVHYKNGTLTFEELWRLQNEYRQFFPNVIFLGLGLLTRWNVRYEMIVIFLLACVTAFNIFRLSLITVKVNKHLRWILFFAACLFIFSPWQYENWLFGVQIEYLLPAACITTSMLILFTKIRAAWKLAFCMILAVFSTFSSINGFTCWIVLFPVLLLTGRDYKYFRKWQIVLAWFAGIVHNLFLYFNGYQSPASYPNTFEVIEHPVNALRYFFAILGNPVRIVHSLNHIIVVGGVLFSFFVLLLLYILRFYKDKRLTHDSIVWIMLGTYSVITATMITVGRLGFGLYQSLTSRYTSFTLFLALSILFLSAIIVSHLSGRLRYPLALKIIASILLTYVVYIKIDTYSVAVDDLKTYHARIQHGKAGLLFINHYSHHNCENKIYPYNPEQLRCWANLLDSLGYLRPALIKTNFLEDIEDNSSNKISFGTLNRIERLDGSNFKAFGTAMKPETRSPVDAVVLTFENIERKSVLLALSNSDSLNWSKAFTLDIVPFDTVKVGAWAFDANTAKAYRLSGTFQLVK